MQPIKHIFFDLDHTIWDFDRNAQETLQELYHAYQLKELGLSSVELFIHTYTQNNHQLWAQYHLGKITKQALREQRFKKTFLDLGLKPELIPTDFEEDYVNISPTKKNLFESAEKVLDYLSKRYQLHIISNGFKEATLTKMQVSNLNPYFKNVVISEEVGVNKPDKAIFEHALSVAKANKPESVMIGDSLEADIYGAQNFGMKAIFFNPLKVQKPNDVEFQINHLEELLKHF
ncbi:YjjG family noncanonical pyrimidine nucleotidase [Pedobacter sp. ASV28]|uniref:YjjG family noncanonical pyrimidine nucleotidase n=1 Tax=Pedobacter sp. ASV28 TaxID=2795123 RepID=UPI0018EE233D|nr:YjjG family noncanonical pyrimidine nucleotidase [Pedobacter sp. ASV28]